MGWGGNIGVHLIIFVIHTHTHTFLYKSDEILKREKKTIKHLVSYKQSLSIYEYILI